MDISTEILPIKTPAQRRRVYKRALAEYDRQWFGLCNRLSLSCNATYQGSWEASNRRRSIYANMHHEFPEVWMMSYLGNGEDIVYNDPIMRIEPFNELPLGLRGQMKDEIRKIILEFAIVLTEDPDFQIPSLYEMDVH
jgi:hypothetical protein